MIWNIFLSSPHNTAHCITVESSKRCKFSKKLVSNSSLTAADVFLRSNNTLSLSYFQCPMACGPVIRSSLRVGPQGDSVTVSVTVSVTTKFLCQSGVSVVSGTNVQQLNFSYSPLQSSVKKMQWTRMWNFPFLCCGTVLFNSINLFNWTVASLQWRFKAPFNNKFLRWGSLLFCQ